MELEATTPQVYTWSKDFRKILCVLKFFFSGSIAVNSKKKVKSPYFLDNQQGLGGTQTSAPFHTGIVKWGSYIFPACSIECAGSQLQGGGGENAVGEWGCGAGGMTSSSYLLSKKQLSTGGAGYYGGSGGSMAVFVHNRSPNSACVLKFGVVK